MRKCKHKWEHVVKKYNNMRNQECLWLIHKCLLCGIEDNGSQIENIVLKKKLTKKLRKRAKRVNEK